MRSSPQTQPAPSIATDTEAVVRFWREAGPDMWFAKDPEFDRRFRERFLPTHEAASLGELHDWAKSADGALALAILLDQFPRNAFRGTPRMYATDGRARDIADAAVHAGYDRRLEDEMALFLYLPFAHSERLEDQDRAVALAARLPEPAPSHSRRHREIIRRFGRFPHRNPILGRTMTADEQRYLEEGGYQG